MKTIVSRNLSISVYLLRLLFSCLLFTTSLFWKSELIYAQCPALTPVILPFLEDFEEVDTTLRVSSALCEIDKVWSLETVSGFAQFGTGLGNNALALIGISEFDTNNVTLTLDMSNYVNSTNILLSFDFLNTDYNTGLNDSVWIRGSNIKTWVSIYSWELNNESKWSTSIEFDIDAALSNAGQIFTNSFQVRFGKGASIGLPGNELTLDNIRLTACPKAIDLKATNVTATSATLSWTELDTTAIGDIEWGNTGFLQGNGNKITGLTNSAFWLFNLSPNTFYDFYVKSGCGNESSFWAGPFTFSTLCNAPNPVSLPFLEDFEYIEDTTLFANGELCRANRTWSFETTSAGTAKFGKDAPSNNGGLGALLLENPNGFSTNNAILTLNMSNYVREYDDIYLIFDFFNALDESSANDSIWIRGDSTNTWIGLYSWQEQERSVWHTSPEFDIDTVLAKVGQSFSSSFQIRFGQADNSIFPDDGLIVDNIRLVTCSKPTNLMATTISPNSANLTWTEMGAATNWNIEWGVKGFSQGDGNIGISIFDSSYELSDLVANTAYDFYVRSVCEE